MTQVTGGRRARYIQQNLKSEVSRILEARGWLDPNRRHTPIRIVKRPQKWDDPIEFNSITVSLDGSTDADAEMGSNRTDDTHTVYIDFYAEGESIGEDVIGDLRDAFRGKLPSIDRARPVLNVYDLMDPAKPLLFVCLIETIVKDRAHNFPHLWQQFWYSLRFDLIDEYYGDENG